MNTFTYEPELAATASSCTGSTAGQYLIFHLGHEEYGIHVPRIREIISLVPLQLAPGLPYCVKGVVHILGKTIPVIDLRLKLGLIERGPVNRTLKKDPDSTWTPEEAAGCESDHNRDPGRGYIVMIDTEDKKPEPGPGGRENNGGAGFFKRPDDPSTEFSFTGIVVDYISEIVNIRPEDIEPVSAAEGRSGLNCILGLVKIGPRTKTLLDIDLAINLDSVPEYAVSRTLASLR